MFHVRLITLLICLVFWGAAGSFGSLEGQSAPDFKLKSLDGTSTLSPKDFQGKVVILDFWASWCAPCKVSLPELAKLEKRYPGLKVLTVNIDDDAKKARAFLQKNKLSLTVAYDADKKVAESYGVEAMPSALILDRNGVVRKVMSGYTIAKKDEMIQAVESLLK